MPVENKDGETNFNNSSSKLNLLSKLCVISQVAGCTGMVEHHH